MKHLKFILFTIAWLMLSFVFGCKLADWMGIPSAGLLLGAALSLFNFVPKGMNLRLSLNTINAADVVTEWGLLYRKQDQTVQDIIDKFFEKSETEAYFPVRYTDATIMEKSSAEFSSVLQAFQKAYTPKGGVTFEPLKIPLYKLKIDLQETPDDLEESWLGFLGGDGIDRTQWPFMKWYLDRALKQQDKDLELNEIYKGVRAAPTPGTAGANGTALQGIKKQLNLLNTAGKLDLKTLGATPTDPVEFVEYVEEMVNMTDETLRNEIDYLFMSRGQHDLFRDGMNEKYNTNYAQVDQKKITQLRNDNISVVGLKSMAGSTKIWGTPEFNRQAGLKRSKNKGIFKVENVDRTVKAYTDYSKGFGFWIGEYVISNDVELT